MLPITCEKCIDKTEKGNIMNEYVMSFGALVVWLIYHYESREVRISVADR